MKKTTLFLSLLLVIVTLTGLCSCSGKNDKVQIELVTEDRNAPKTKIGSGEHSFFFEITDKDGNLTSYKVESDEEKVGKALDAYGLAMFTLTDEKAGGDNDDVKFDSYKVDIIGKELEEGAHWDMYVDGKIFEKDPLSLDVRENTIYSFVYISK